MASPVIEVMPDPVQRWLGKEYAKSCRGREWYPQTQSQFNALCNEADILLLSGTAGSLKTSTMLVDGIQDRTSPKMNTYFFRRTYPAMEDAQRQAHELFPQLGFKSVDSHGGFTRTWRAPAGGTFAFRQLMTKKDLDNNWGKEMSTALFDEASHWEEEYPRVILSRNRSSDPDLKIRCRLGTNPGGAGMVWIMKMFFNNVCPHCEPEKAPPQGVLRYGGSWPTVGTKLEDPLTGEKLSIAYILGDIHDHNLLGNSYLARLRMQSPSLAAALEAGCWKQFEGQYFDIWDFDSMTVAHQDIKPEWWWAHWTGSDYGYSGSAAASISFARSPEGIVYVTDEYPSDQPGARREDVKTFAKNHYNRLVKFHPDSIYTQPKRVDAMYLGRDSWAQRGDSHTLADQMNAVLEEYELAFSPIGDDRAGGAQLWYTGLRDGWIKISRSCTNLIQAISSRIHDPDEPMKTLKVPGDYLDDYMDAGFHGLYGYLDIQGKPKQLERQEKFIKLYQQDPTSAHVMYHRMAREAAKDDESGPAFKSDRFRRPRGRS